MNKKKRKTAGEWWEERDDIERAGIIFLTGCAISAGIGLLIGHCHASNKYKTQLLAKDAAIAELEALNAWTQPALPEPAPMTMVHKIVVDDPEIIEIVKILEDVKEGK